MYRIYEPIVLRHFRENNEMLFLTGPRQSGKTTIALEVAKKFQESLYLNWDIIEDRQTILSGHNFLEKLGIGEVLTRQRPLIIFDEIHKYSAWKPYLKGFFDKYQNKVKILVTGSTRLDILHKSGESLMGRYFELRIHPISVAEIIFHQEEAGQENIRTADDSNITLDKEIKPPKNLEQSYYNDLYEYGGFPKPFLQANKRFYNRWNSLRKKQLFYEDISTLTHIQEIHQMEVLAELLLNQAGQLVNYSSLAKKIQVTVQTISRWIKTLEKFYYCFTIKPWSNNISRSLIKEPKIYLWDYSAIPDAGSKFENFVAIHLLKAIDLWNDQGLGEYGLYYLRDKQKNEVDFLISKNKQPWFLVEAKTSKQSLGATSLRYFQQQTGVKYAFQVVKEMEYLDIDCFGSSEESVIITVPAKTYLSQLA
jgi:predicted AAA+ superfamily ATPase